MVSVEFHPIRTPKVEQGADLIGILLKSTKEEGLEVQDKDIMVISSKVVCYQQNRIVNFGNTVPSKEAEKLSEKYGLPAGRIQVYLNEADRIFGGVFFSSRKFLLFFTLKNGIVSGNSGVDIKNCPPGHCSLQVKDPEKTAWKIREEVFSRTGKKVGVIISDTEFSPLRYGGIGLAIATAGFEPVKNWVGRPDIYGTKVPLARSNMADPIASMAGILSGEGGDFTPLVLVRNANVEFTDDPESKLGLLPEEDPMLSVFRPSGEIQQWYDWNKKTP